MQYLFVQYLYFFLYFFIAFTLDKSAEIYALFENYTKCNKFHITLLLLLLLLLGLCKVRNF